MHKVSILNSFFPKICYQLNLQSSYLTFSILSYYYFVVIRGSYKESCLGLIAKYHLIISEKNPVIFEQIQPQRDINNNVHGIKHFKTKGVFLFNGSTGSKSLYKTIISINEKILTQIIYHRKE